MFVRKTRTIVTDVKTSHEVRDIELESDVIMTAAIVGLAARTILENTKTGAAPGVRFDMDPRDKDKSTTNGATEWADFKRIIAKVDRAIADYINKKYPSSTPKGAVSAALAEDFAQGAVIMGVYHLADQKPPTAVKSPDISAAGTDLYKKISANSLGGTPMYVGRGAYTGFVDSAVDPKTKAKTAIGPLSTARFTSPDLEIGATDAIVGPTSPRWYPPEDSEIWKPRLRAFGPDKTSYVAWGLIRGDAAGQKAEGVVPETNVADDTTLQMSKEGMPFFGNPSNGAGKPPEIFGYTHGMIQAVYKAYHSGPGATPYEIAVGSKTTKMSSCFACTTFMTATGYPPTSIHLGRAESWMPLLYPYTPEGKTDASEIPVIRDLNNRWYQACSDYLAVGLQIMDDTHIEASHKDARNNVLTFLKNNTKPSVAATLILDALTFHKSEAPRADATLKQL